MISEDLGENPVRASSNPFAPKANDGRQPAESLGTGPALVGESVD
jgi:hypothetical protein